MLQFGIDQLLSSSPQWKKQHIGFVTNDAARTNSYVSSRKALLDNGFNLVKLFSPEHGIQTKGADGVLIKDGHDSVTALPIVSLYNNKLQPSTADLQGIDLLLFDIPDIGCRFYTYLWTMTYILQAVAANNIPLIILDRPNPISGLMELAEGPLLDEEHCSSFIGRWQIPLRHSCTMGELALYFNATKNIHAALEIIACKGWERRMFQPDWQVDFIPTSPAIRSFESALLYPGMGLLEATNISEGRGTKKAFQIAGAPWLNSVATAALMQDDFARCMPEDFAPVEGEYAHQTCRGIYFEVKDHKQFQPVSFAVKFIRLVKQMHPEGFSWQPYSTMVNPTGENHLDLLLGIENSQALFDLPYDEFLFQTKKLTQANWSESILPFLLYK